MDIGMSFFLADAVAIGGFVSTLLADKVFFHRGFMDKGSMVGKRELEGYKKAA